MTSLVGNSSPFYTAFWIIGAILVWCLNSVVNSLNLAPENCGPLSEIRIISAESQM